MYYNISELMANLGEKVEELGISPAFKENPAYDTALGSISALLHEIKSELPDQIKEAQFSLKNGVISFACDLAFGEKYAMSILCDDPTTFRCIRTKGKVPYIGTDGLMNRSKDVVEEVVTVDEKTGHMTLTTNRALLCADDSMKRECINLTNSEKCDYTSDGIMERREIKDFGTGKLSEDYSRAGIGSILYIPRNAFGMTLWSDKYEDRTLLTREKLDTARLVVEDKKKNIKYNATVRLSSQHGLKNMYLDVPDLPEDITIMPLLPAEIDELIQSEKDPRVAAGLRKYAVGRDQYFYNSRDDRYFVCEGTKSEVEKTSGAHK